jgi:hypothetical protein
MSRPRYRLTSALQEPIVAFIRAGGFPHVAAEAAGLPRQVFTRWLERGQRADAPPTYRAFAAAVMEAQAQARLHAELTARSDKPLDWLKAGPGKDAADNPGWSNPGKPRSASAEETDKGPSWAGILALFGQCAERLTAHPEARAELAAWLAELPPRRPSK